MDDPTTSALIPAGDSIPDVSTEVKFLLSMRGIADIVESIALYCDPETLFNLSKSHSAFRNSLTAPGSQQIWNVSFASAGLPECPRDMSPLRFAAYIFDRTCNICREKKNDLRSINFLHATRSKFCTKCVERSQIFVGMNKGDPLYGIVPWMRARLHRGGATVRVVEQAALNQLAASYNAIESEAAKEQWVAAGRAWMEEQMKIMIPIEDWWSARYKEIKRRRHEIKEQRLNKILQTLDEQGWSVELREMEASNFYRIRRLPGVLTRHELTDRGWKRIEPRLIALMERWRDSLLAANSDTELNGEL